MFSIVASCFEHLYTDTHCHRSGSVLLRFPQQLQQSFHLGYFHLWTFWQVLALLHLHTKTQSVESIVMKTMRLQSEPFWELWCYYRPNGRCTGLLQVYYRFITCLQLPLAAASFWCCQGRSSFVSSGLTQTKWKVGLRATDSAGPPFYAGTVGAG